VTNHCVRQRYRFAADGGAADPVAMGVARIDAKWVVLAIAMLVGGNLVVASEVLYVVWGCIRPRLGFIWLSGIAR